jgi:pyridoxal phosphate enzyme (YggS family)
MSELEKRIADNLARVRARIAAAAVRSGRSADAVRLVAVTKYAGHQAARALIAAGCGDLGESRPQELWDKAAAISDPQVRWHLVGHLQRNKVRRTLPLVSLVHSVDSQRLLAALDDEAAAADRRVAVLLEVNISGEAAKHGLPHEDVGPLLARAGEFPHVEVRGLMGMAGLSGGETEARREFARLRELRDRLQAGCPAGVSLEELSMGMSQDFEAAIGEGATIVRIGSALFEGVE